MPPQAHLRLVTYGYVLWCRIDMRNRECDRATVDLDRTTHDCCVPSNLPVRGVGTLLATSMPCLYLGRYGMTSSPHTQAAFEVMNCR
jgi:hypothetical protein